MDSNQTLTIDEFNLSIENIIKISNDILDGWTLHVNKENDNGKYITKKSTISIEEPGKGNPITLTYEHHVVFSLSYSVPMICFNVWKADGSVLSMEEYLNINQNFDDSNMYNTITQLDHPVLCRPFLTLHPCKTQEIIEPFLSTSKNPVISWLTVVSSYVHLKILEEYIKHC
ncbi:unnamed protein product [Brassicogethes aeneus]|uniref:Ubiquitin-like-conjugating enzyme ATG10 n=1 Tax=Brassicogethes aeneus TaxID=1431903 RepID=A0A9P0B555_BRAAE|nr:unnamed protein product [Brassicogethes aeneus]